MYSLKAQLVTSDYKSSYDAATKALNDQLNQIKAKWESMLSTLNAEDINTSTVIDYNNEVISKIEQNIKYAIALKESL